MELTTKNKLITEGSALSIPEMIKHHNALIKLYKDLSKIERDRKNLNAPKISFNKTAREVCNTASIRINAYDDFILHLQGCITLMRDGGN